MRIHPYAYDTQIRKDPDDGSIEEDLEKGTTIEPTGLKENTSHASIATEKAIQVKNSTTSITQLGHRYWTHVVSVEKAGQAEASLPVIVPDGGLRAWLVVVGVCVLFIVAHVIKLLTDNHIKLYIFCRVCLQ